MFDRSQQSGAAQYGIWRPEPIPATQGTLDGTKIGVVSGGPASSAAPTEDVQVCLNGETGFHGAAAVTSRRCYASSMRCHHPPSLHLPAPLHCFLLFLPAASRTALAIKGRLRSLSAPQSHTSLHLHESMPRCLSTPPSP
jgi:hypothetical protein